MNHRRSLVTSSRGLQTSYTSKLYKLLLLVVPPVMFLTVLPCVPDADDGHIDERHSNERGGGGRGFLLHDLPRPRPRVWGRRGGALLPRHQRRVFHVHSGRCRDPAGMSMMLCSMKAHLCRSCLLLFLFYFHECVCVFVCVCVRVCV